MNIYIDGSCLGNPGPGGYAVICTKNDKLVYECSGHLPYTTNNHMELQAAITALECVDNNVNNFITLFTDSLYVKNGIEKWIVQWKTKKNWKNGERKNQDLWEKLDYLNQKLQPQWQWIKAHSGNKWNERADRLAKEKAQEYKLKDKLKDQACRLNKGQQEALSFILRGKNIFITGGGGTGKSEFLRYYIKHYKSKKIAITSTTGTSAILIGGTTLHSYLGIGLGKGSVISIAQKVKKKKYLRERWKNLQILIIDEISMLSAELFDKLEEVARIIRTSVRPFGGIQLILSGDFCQLPCIGSNLFCFEAKSWVKCIDKIIYLEEIMRQRDLTFQRVLKNLRLGIKDEITMKIINSRVNSKFKNKFGIIPTKLFSHNALVDELNCQELHSLAHKNKSDILVYDHMIQLNTKRKIKYFQAPKSLELTKGCQVMLLVNLDIPNKLVNGSRGIVLNFIEDKPLIRFMNGQERVIDYHIWEIEENYVKLGTIEQ